MSQPLITFDDVNIIPKFSDVPSRESVDLSVNIPGFPYATLPVISANMDTVTGSEMAKAMLNYGAQACLHRFSSIEENVKMFLDSRTDNGFPLVSVGLSMKELERAEALLSAGAMTFVIDVNHGANIEVVRQAKMLRDVLGKDAGIIVGNFATGKSIEAFVEHLGNPNIVDGFKVGIGGGSTCTTRIKTGVGIPQMSALMDCRGILRKLGLAMIADGAMRTAGDIAKALGVGAHFAMIGGMVAGTNETPGEKVWRSGAGTLEGKDTMFPKKMNLLTGKLEIEENYNIDETAYPAFKKYRGSASHESYIDQGKVAKHRTAEGESFLVPFKGPVFNVLQDIEGGLRGSFSMVGAWNTVEYHQKAEFVRVSSAATIESGAHGKK